MNVRRDRIARVQAGMRQHGLLAIMVMNHDDYRYLFGRDRTQPRALLPAEGPPELIVSTGEEPEARAAFPEGEVRVFSSVGGQIHDVVGRLRELVAASGAGDAPGSDGKPKVGMQQWFDTPAFLVDLFRQVNPEVELVSSDPVMDPIRAIKDDGELELMRAAQRIAGLGMDRAREMLVAGVRARELATEVACTMMRAGAERTSTPIYVNFGVDTCMLHGGLSESPLREGELAFIDLTPQVEGYCANLSRTFILGQPDPRQAGLLAAYRDIHAELPQSVRPDVTVAKLDEAAGVICERHGLGAYRLNGIGHGIGLRFEETPAPTIIPPHRGVPLREGMTFTIGHTVLAIPGFGGVRFEDVYRVGADGAEPLAPYPVDPVIRAVS